MFFHLTRYKGGYSGKNAKRLFENETNEENHNFYSHFLTFSTFPHSLLFLLLLSTFPLSSLENTTLIRGIRMRCGPTFQCA